MPFTQMQPLVAFRHFCCLSLFLWNFRQGCCPHTPLSQTCPGVFSKSRPLCYLNQQPICQVGWLVPVDTKPQLLGSLIHGRCLSLLWCLCSASCCLTSPPTGTSSAMTLTQGVCGLGQAHHSSNPRTLGPGQTQKRNETRKGRGAAQPSLP